MKAIIIETEKNKGKCSLISKRERQIRLITYKLYEDFFLNECIFVRLDGTEQTIWFSNEGWQIIEKIPQQAYEQIKTRHDKDTQRLFKYHTVKI